jgi:hypothetical protein
MCAWSTGCLRHWRAALMLALTPTPTLWPKCRPPCAAASCARPPFSMERLRKAGSTLVYRCAKQHSEPASDRRGPRADELTLTPLELINRIAALVPSPRTHRHRYYGALAPHSPLRMAVTALAQAAPSQLVKVQVDPATANDGVGGFLPGNSVRPSPNLRRSSAHRRSQAHYLWAVLIARIYEVFPMLCPSAVGICASSPSSRTAPISGTCSITSGCNLCHQTSHQRAGHRCGMSVMRRWVKVPKSNQTGIWQSNRHPTTRWTSASIGE